MGVLKSDRLLGIKLKVIIEWVKRLYFFTLTVSISIIRMSENKTKISIDLIADVAVLFYNYIELILKLKVANAFD